MAARGGGWPGNAEPLHVSFSLKVSSLLHSLISNLIIPKEIDLKGRKVSRGDGNLVSVEYEFFYLFEP